MTGTPVEAATDCVASVVPVALSNAFRRKDRLPAAGRGVRLRTTTRSVPSPKSLTLTVAK